VEEFLKVLACAESVEEMASEVYGRYAEAYADDEEAAFLFYRLHVEEKSHRALVKFTALAVEHGRARFSAAPLQSKPLKALQAQLSAELSQPPPSTLAEAVRRALDLEVLLGESYQKTRLAAVGDAAARLAASLDEKEHAGNLVAFARRRGIL